MDQQPIDTVAALADHPRPFAVERWASGTFSIYDADGNYLVRGADEMGDGPVLAAIVAEANAAEGLRARVAELERDLSARDVKAAWDAHDAQARADLERQLRVDALCAGFAGSMEDGR